MCCVMMASHDVCLSYSLCFRITKSWNVEALSVVSSQWCAEGAKDEGGFDKRIRGLVRHAYKNARPNIPNNIASLLTSIPDLKRIRKICDFSNCEGTMRWYLLLVSRQPLYSSHSFFLELPSQDDFFTNTTNAVPSVPYKNEWLMEYL
jgi:hypothetical protein